MAGMWMVETGWLGCISRFAMLCDKIGPINQESELEIIRFLLCSIVGSLAGESERQL